MACHRKKCKGKTCSSWRDNPKKTVNYAAICMDSIARKLVSPLLPLEEKHWDHKKNGIIARIWMKTQTIFYCCFNTGKTQTISYCC
jgi:hypothetical protein